MHSGHPGYPRGACWTHNAPTWAAGPHIIMAATDFLLVIIVLIALGLVGVVRSGCVEKWKEGSQQKSLVWGPHLESKGHMTQDLNSMLYMHIHTVTYADFRSFPQFGLYLLPPMGSHALLWQLRYSVVPLLGWKHQCWWWALLSLPAASHHIIVLDTLSWSSNLIDVAFSHWWLWVRSGELSLAMDSLLELPAIKQWLLLPNASMVCPHTCASWFLECCFPCLQSCSACQCPSGASQMLCPGLRHDH